MRDVPMLSIWVLRRILGVDDIGFLCGFYGGSRVICDPPPTDTDRDLCLHVTDVSNAVKLLEDAGWSRPDDLEEYPDEYESFATLRKGDDNVMLFDNAYEFGAVWGATNAAQTMNLLEKSERYKLFEAARKAWR